MTRAPEGPTEGVTKIASAMALASLKAQEILRLSRIEGKLGLPTGYYQTLETEGSDWEFAIKLVVLLEAALGSVIAAKLQNPAMVHHCERLSLAGRAGKLALAEDLGVLTRVECKSLATLADIRNGFAHRVSNIQGDLKTYAAALDPPTLMRLGTAMMMVPDHYLGQVRALFEPAAFPPMFRYVMWTAGSMLVDALATQDVHAEAEAARLQWLRPADGTNAIAPLASLFGSQPPGPI